jgi:RNA polymerase sigma factor (sigma-70 family)
MPARQLTAFVRRLRCLDSTDGELLDRFIREKDQATFEALVRRHGPTVLGVCRRVLGNQQDAEDCFQATFLVLVRRAAAVRSREVVGSWLYGVAYRTALGAKRAMARRRAKELKAMPRMEAEKDPDLTEVLDEELSRLPEHYKSVVILADLEGRNRREVAEELGLAEGTVASRLARGRAILAGRLTRRGVTLSGAGLAGALSGHAASAGVPAALASVTVKAAMLVAAGHAVTSGKVAALVKGALTAMLMTKIKRAMAVAVVAALVCYGLGLPTETVFG